MKKTKLGAGLAFAAGLAISGILLGSFGKSMASAQTSKNPDAGLSIYRIPRSVASIAALSGQLEYMNSAEVVRIVDGDTIVVSFAAQAGFINPEKIRLIGVDTPESVDPRRPVERFGAEAARYARDRLSGKTVYVAFERKLRDSYDRLLAYVFLADGCCVNLDIVSAGYGFAYTKYPFYFMDDFRRAEKEARREKRGLWADS